VLSTLDRYLIRQAIPPFLLALGIYTFVLAVQPTLEYAKLLLAKGVPLSTVGVLLLLLLPQALSLTIPMAFLTGLLMALGRASADRESVALLACGVSPLRVLRPVLALGVLVAGLDMYVLMQATPDSNQAYRDITFRLLTEQTAADIKPRVFFSQFPGKVLYVGDVDAAGGWKNVLLADTAEPGRPPTVTLADAGALLIDREQRLVRLVLEHATQYAPGKADPRLYTLSYLDQPVVAISPEAVFGSGRTIPGMHEMSRAQLLEEIANKRAAGIPAHAEIMQLHQMYAFPAACLVFAAMALGLGLNTRRDGRLAGLTLGLAVIVFYYAVMMVAEGWTKGLARTGGSVDIVAAWARWVPDIVTAVVAAFALYRLTRPPGRGDLGRYLPVWIPRMAARPASSGRTAQARPASGRPVVAIRLPSLGLPRPRLLDRYVTKRFLTSASLAFLSLLALYYIGTFVDLADKLFKQQADAALFASFLIQSTPQFVVFVIPVTILVAVLGTIGALTRSSELIVMRACGVSLYRTALPLLGCALIGSVLLFAIDDRVLGEANRTARLLRDTLRDKNPQSAPISADSNYWRVGEDGRIYAYEAFGVGTHQAPGQPMITGLSVFETAHAPYRLRSHLYATRVRFDAGQWRAEYGWSQRFQADRTASREDFDSRVLDLPAVVDFQRAQVDPSAMTFGEYRDYVRRLGASGFDVAEQRVTLHTKLAFPFVTIVMTLLAVPFGVTVGRKGTLYGIGLAAILAVGYFLLMTFFAAAGSAGLLPPVLAAWGANILFGAGAAYLGLTVRT